MNEDTRSKLRDCMRAVCVVVASFMIALNINSFVSEGGLYPGGFNGITVLIQRISYIFFKVEISFSLVNILLNAIPAFIGFRMIGKKFTIYSCIMIFLTGFFVDILPVIPITEDILLIAIFGGIINGVAISIALMGRASSGGTDFIAMALSKKTNAPSWNYMLGLNAVILVLAGWLFGWDKALYSIIFQFCSTQVVNAMHTRYKQMTLLVVTDKPELIIPEIMHLTHHGVTRLEGVGGYSNEKRELLYTVISRDEVKKVRKAILQIDANVFMNVTKTEQIAGRFYQEPMD